MSEETTEFAVIQKLLPELQAEGYEVINVALDGIYVPDQEKNLEDVYIKLLKAGIIGSLSDSLLDCCVEEAVDGRIEVVQRHQYVHVAVGDNLPGSLESIQDGPLATGQVQASGPNLANRLEDFLEQFELVRNKRVILDEVVGVREVVEDSEVALAEG